VFGIVVLILSDLLRCGWKEFQHISPLLTFKWVALEMKEIVIVYVMVLEGGL